jgi:hypothetical protein
MHGRKCTFNKASCDDFRVDSEMIEENLTDQEEEVKLRQD